MDRKARIVRFWLLILAMFCAVVACPELAVGLWPVAFFFPGCACCGNDCGIDHVACTPGTGPNEITIDIAGMTGTCSDGVTSCSVIDGVYVATYGESISNGCRYDYTFSPSRCPTGGGSGTSGFTALQAFIQKNLATSQTRVYVRLASHAGSMDWRSADQGASPFDCATLGTVSCPTLDDLNTSCGYVGSTCDVTV